MNEAAIDISGNKSKGFEELPLMAQARFDYVVSMGCKDICPFVAAVKSLNWDIENPKGKDINTFRKVRDNIRDKVDILVKEINNKKEVKDEKAFG
jgi:protein-tyrosine-phosphatase